MALPSGVVNAFEVLAPDDGDRFSMPMIKSAALIRILPLTAWWLAANPPRETPVVSEAASIGS